MGVDNGWIGTYHSFLPFDDEDCVRARYCLNLLHNKYTPASDMFYPLLALCKTFQFQCTKLQKYWENDFLNLQRSQMKRYTVNREPDKFETD